MGRAAAPLALPAALSAAAGLALAQPGTPSAPRPPAPRIYRHPLPRTGNTTADFAFNDAGADTSFLCSLDGRTYRRCASSQLFRRLHAGAHRFRVVAQDGAGHRSRPSSYNWRINSARVIRISIVTAAPMIVRGPANSTSASTATFNFSDSAAGVQFVCTLDSRAPAICESPTTYSALSSGAHTFRVTARYAIGQQSQPASYKWQVRNSSAGPVTVTGDAQGSLYPGAGPEPIAVTLSNPTSTGTSVTSLSVSIDHSLLPAGCDPSSFELTQPNVSSTQPVTVPGNGAVTLPAQGVAAPTIAMLDTDADQDGCQGATLTLDYTDAAHQ